MNGPTEDVGAVGKGKHVRQGPKEQGQLIYREEQPAQENHGKAEKIRKSLGLEHLADRNGDEKA